MLFLSRLLVSFAAVFFSGAGLAGYYTCPSGGYLSGTSCIVNSSYPASLQSCDRYNLCSTARSGSTCTYASTWYDTCTGWVSQDIWSNACQGCTQSWVTGGGGFSYTCPSGGSLSGSLCYTTSSYPASYVQSSCSLPWGGSINHGSSTTAYSTSSVPYGSSCTSQTRTCNDGTLSGSGSFGSCGALPQDISSSSGLSATDGTVTNAINLTWSAFNGATGYDIQYRKQGTTTWSTLASPTSNSYTFNTTDYSIFEFQVRGKNAYGTTSWSPTETGFAAKQCPTGNVTWGASNYCAYNMTTTGTVGNVRAASNQTAGAVGSATVTCNGLTGMWNISAATCNVSLATAATFAATDGTVSNGINLSWSAISGASTYTVQQRKQGSTTWSDLVTQAGTSYNWTGLSDESVFEFQLRANNPVGSGNWSSVETGYIRKILDPKFVSETAVPTKIGINQNFNVSQTWRNDGSETWVNATHGTGPYNPTNTSVWTLGNLGVPSSTATGASVTIAGTFKAPATPGTYPFQRTFQKSGTPIGNPTPVTSVRVFGNPTCSTVTPEVSSTYDRLRSVKVTIAGVDQEESVELKAWTDYNGQDDLRTYSPTKQADGTWQYSVPLGNHTGYGKLNLVARVGNTVFGAVDCATSSLNIDDLPVPQMALAATQGTFSGNGYVLNVANNTFANATVTTPGFSSLKTRIELRDASNNLLTTATNVANSTPTAVKADNVFAAGAPAWSTVNASLVVVYEDAAAAEQGKKLTLPISLRVPPRGMAVTAAISNTQPYMLTAQLRKDGLYNPATHGSFTARAMSGSNAVATLPQSVNGDWTFTGLDVATLYGYDNTVVAVAVPPSGVTLVTPIEFVSNVIDLPVTPPNNVSASDDAYEDDIVVSWQNTLPPTVPGVKYLVYRNGEMITPAAGVSTTSFTDANIQERGTPHVYVVRAVVNGRQSVDSAPDNGSVPLCRAIRLVGASLNADMTAINGMIEQWACLTGVSGTSAIDAQTPSALSITGTPSYTSFSVPVDPTVPDGAHTLNLTFDSQGVSINASRSYAIPFTLDRASISVNSVQIIYNGAPVVNGQTSESIGLFGVQMDGGSGIGFAQPVN